MEKLSSLSIQFIILLSGQHRLYQRRGTSTPVSPKEEPVAMKTSEENILRRLRRYYSQWQNNHLVCVSGPNRSTIKFMAGGNKQSGRGWRALSCGGNFGARALSHAMCCDSRKYLRLCTAESALGTSGWRLIMSLIDNPVPHHGELLDHK